MMDTCTTTVMELIIYTLRYYRHQCYLHMMHRVSFLFTLRKTDTYILTHALLANFRSGNDENYFSDHHRQKYRRPGLRSTVSELPARGVKSFYLDCMAMPPKFEKRSSYNSKAHFYSGCHFSSSGEEDEENAPLLYYSSSSGKKGKQYKVKLKNARKRKMIQCKWLAIVSLTFSVLLCLMLLFTASPLREIEVSSISNVLGTRKQLILDLHIQAT